MPFVEYGRPFNGERTMKTRCIGKCLLMAVLFLVGVCASAKAGDNGKALSIMASFYPMYIATLNVAKDVPGVKVSDLTKPQTGCLHDYQITTEDMRNLSTADIFVANGAGMESFLDKVVKELPKVKVIEASKGIPLIKGDGDEGDNPHIWVSVTLYMQQVKNIGEQLAKIDPVHADMYAKNTDAYLAKLEALRKEMHDGLKALASRDIITFHEAFPYFAKEFELNIVAVIEREPGSEPDAKELAKTIETVKKSGIKALYAEPQYPAKAAEAIAKETGAKVYTLDPAVTGPMDADSYVASMRQNLAVLQKSLKQ